MNAYILLMIALAAGHQIQDVKRPSDPFPSWNDSITTMPPLKQHASYSEQIGADGHYRVMVDDPNNEWRCYSTTTTSDPYIVIITCVKPHEVQKDLAPK